MANGAWGGGKGDQDRTRNKEAFNDNFNKIFPNAFVPSWKRRAQEEAAAAEGAFFWNAAAAMAAGEGAACAIHTWVLAEPPLAYSDHVHLTPAGAERLAARFWEALMGPYETAQCRARAAGNALF